MQGIDPRTEAIGAVGGEQEKVSALRMVRVLVAGEDKMRNGCGSRPAIIRDFPAELAGWGQVPALGEGRLSDRHKAQRTGRREAMGGNCGLCFVPEEPLERGVRDAADLVILTG